VDEGTRIGANVMMGPEVVIFSYNHATSRVDIPMIRQGFTACFPVTIGDDVWIGRRVIILPGVTVGSGCILGAGAVISRDVPPGAVAVGNPARVVRYRHASFAVKQHISQHSSKIDASEIALTKPTRHETRHETH
jgi:acetyltransferase-like isoleucine patch superfamily enzyme